MVGRVPAVPVDKGSVGRHEGLRVSAAQLTKERVQEHGDAFEEQNRGPDALALLSIAWKPEKMEVRLDGDDLYPGARKVKVRQIDIISMLVDIYGSKELFVEQYQCAPPSPTSARYPVGMVTRKEKKGVKKEMRAQLELDGIRARPLLELVPCWCDYMKTHMLVRTHALMHVHMHARLHTHPPSQLTVHRRCRSYGVTRHHYSARSCVARGKAR